MNPLESIRMARIDKKLSTRECAKLCGMEPLKFNGIERWLCVPSEAEKGAIISVLGDVSFPTPEDVKNRRAESDRLSAHMAEARARIKTAAGGARGGQGSVKCPACEQGHLRFSIAGINGHIHAHCSTSGCLSWME